MDFSPARVESVGEAIGDGGHAVEGVGMALHVVLDHAVDGAAAAFGQTEVDRHDVAIEHVNVKVLLVADAAALQVGVGGVGDLPLNLHQLV